MFGIWADKAKSQYVIAIYLILKFENRLAPFKGVMPYSFTF